MRFTSKKCGCEKTEETFEMLFGSYLIPLWEVFIREAKYMERTILRGDIYYAGLNPVVGSEQGGVRPVLVIQNNTGNKHNPKIIVAAITSRVKSNLTTHIKALQYAFLGSA